VSIANAGEGNSYTVCSREHRTTVRRARMLSRKPSAIALSPSVVACAPRSIDRGTGKMIFVPQNSSTSSSSEPLHKAHCVTLSRMRKKAGWS
jgi:hypothetical protein